MMARALHDRVPTGAKFYLIMVSIVLTILLVR